MYVPFLQPLLLAQCGIHIHSHSKSTENFVCGVREKTIELKTQLFWKFPLKAFAEHGTNDVAAMMMMMLLKT